MSKTLFNKNEFVYLIEPKDLLVDSTGKITRPAIKGGAFQMTVFESDGVTPITGLIDLPFVEAGGSGVSGVYKMVGPGQYVPVAPASVWIEIKETGLYANRCYWYFKRNIAVRVA